MSDQADIKRPVSASKNLVEGEYPFTQEDFRNIAAMLHADAGIALPDSKATLAYSRLAKRLRGLGLKSFKDYCALVASQAGVEERQKMLASLTTNVTRFFREPHHFDHLKTKVLPDLLAQAKRGGRVRIWSAGCSTGQEPYSMAMLLRESFPNLSDWDVKIHATDLSERALSQARSGIYSRSEMQRGLTQEQISRHFTRLESGHYQVNSDLRKMIQFENINLIKPWQVLPKSDLILMRNILIYFNQEKKQMVLSKMRDQLSDAGGYLMLGASESILFDASFKLHRLERVSYYSKA